MIMTPGGFYSVVYEEGRCIDGSKRLHNIYYLDYNKALEKAINVLKRGCEVKLEWHMFLDGAEPIKCKCSEQNKG